MTLQQFRMCNALQGQICKFFFDVRRVRPCVACTPQFAIARHSNGKWDYWNMHGLICRGKVECAHTCEQQQEVLGAVVNCVTCGSNGALESMSLINNDHLQSTSKVMLCGLWLVHSLEWPPNHCSSLATTRSSSSNQQTYTLQNKFLTPTTPRGREELQVHTICCICRLFWPTD